MGNLIRAQVVLSVLLSLVACDRHTEKPALPPISYADYQVATSFPMIAGEVRKVSGPGVAYFSKGVFSRGAVEVDLPPLASGHLFVEGSVFEDGGSILQFFDTERRWAAYLHVAENRTGLESQELLRTRNEPDLRKAAEMYPTSFDYEWLRIGGTKALQSVNRKPRDVDQKGLAMLAVGNGYSSKSSGACRIDRYMVVRGTFIRILALTQRVDPESKACDWVAQLADWFHHHIRVQGKPLSGGI